MMEILEEIQIGDGGQCTNMAEETCNYLGIDLKLFETMAEHAALDDWTMASTCYVQQNGRKSHPEQPPTIVESRPELEGSEKYLRSHEKRRG